MRSALICVPLGLALDFHFQNSRKPSRCQRRSVSGWMMRSASFHPRTRLESTSNQKRSRRSSAVFDLAVQNAELVTQESILGDEFRFATRQVRQCAANERMGMRTDQMSESRLRKGKD